MYNYQPYKNTVTPQEEREWRQLIAQSFDPRQWFDEDCDRDDEPQEVELLCRPLRNGSGRWEVGFYTPDKVWEQVSIEADRPKAIWVVRWLTDWLNGGD